MTRKRLNWLIGGGILLAVGALVIGRWAFVPEWKRYQTEYRKLMGELYGRRIQIVDGIQEAGSRKVGRADRCITCHLGAGEPLLEGLSHEQPFAAHSSMYHSIEEFGCTICHRGDGSAVTKRRAHENPASPQYRMLPLGDTEASCGSCHKARRVADAWELSEGRRLIDKYDCAGCHAIPNHRHVRKAGFDLTGLGSKVNRAWLKGWLKDPRGYDPSSSMPSFGLSDEQIERLCDFLLSSENPQVRSLATAVKSGATEEQDDEKETKEETSPQQLAARGRVQFKKRQCRSCHSLGGKGGQFGPALDKLATKVRKDWLLAWLKYPEKYFPDTRMPRYSFPAEEIEALTEYLMKTTADPATPIEEVQLSNKPLADIRAEDIERGKALFREYGCYGCHRRKGIDERRGIGPSLAGVGSRPVEKLDFGSSNIPKTLPDYVFTKLESPRSFSTKLTMPDFHLAKNDAHRITVALLALSEEPIAEKLIVRPPVHRSAKPTDRAAKILHQYHCLDCHMIHEEGNPLGPDLSFAGSKLQREWLVSYLAKPFAIRPIVTTKMPMFGLSDAKIGALADYFEEFLTMALVPDALFASSKPSEEMVRYGRELYFQEYGCDACHISGKKGGVYGPSLNGAGRRLNSGWIYAFLRNPRAFDPRTIIPDFGIPPAQAKALTAFVMSLTTDDEELNIAFQQVSPPADRAIPDDVKGRRRHEATKGKRIYYRYCVFCHGADGRGNGINAKHLEVHPADFADVDRMARRRVTDLVNAVQNGGKSIGLSVQMPPYGKTLSKRDVQQVVAYVRTFVPYMDRFRRRRSLAQNKDANVGR